MKLIQRVNVILLPVILLVFAITGVLAYLALNELAFQRFRDRLVGEVQFLQQEVDLELRSLRAALSESLNSAEMLTFMNAQSAEYQAYMLESRLQQQLRKSREHNPGVKLFVVMDLQGHSLIDANFEDPFAEPGLPVNLQDSASAFLSSLVSGSDFDAHEVMVTGAQGAIQFARFQPFSPRMLVEDSLAAVDKDTYVAVVVAEIRAFSRLRAKLAAEFGDQFSLQVSRGEQPGNDSQGGRLSTIRGADDLLALEFASSLYQLRLEAPIAVGTPRVAKARLQLSMLVLVLTAFSFFALRLLIRRQIVLPINRLAEQVNKSQHENIRLERLAQEDEVSELNNAYVSLLEDVHQLASYDHLTGLANRRSFQLMLERRLRRAGQASGELALLFIDLDNFKRVNDQYGHATGDRLLQHFSELLQHSVRPSDVAAILGKGQLARLAGDEFALLLTDSPGTTGAQRVAERILGLFAQGLEVDGVEHRVQASVGIALAPDDGVDAETLLRNADAAMYSAKRSGKNRYQFFNWVIAANIEQQQSIEKTLDVALETDGLHLVYMPIYEADDLSPAGAEVLLRCPALAEENVGPDVFIPVAETTGQIKLIDLWVIEEALKNLSSLRATQDFQGYLAINISSVELHNPEFPGQVSALLDKYRTDPALIELEITETSLVEKDADSMVVLQALKSLGLRLSLDDFGTGYTAFTELADYPVDSLKIDRSFVWDIGNASDKKSSMVEIILTLARLYRLRVIAEGVETQEQLDFLRECGCQQLQGYLLSKPLSWTDMQALAASTAFSGNLVQFATE